MDNNLQFQQPETNELTKKSAIQIMVFYVLLFFIGSFFIALGVKSIPNTTIEYSATNQIIDELQLKYGLSYITKNEFNKLSEEDIQKIDVYKQYDNYYLITTKDLFKDQDMFLLNIPTLYTTENLYYTNLEQESNLKHKIDRFGLKDNSEFEQHFNLENKAIYNKQFEDGIAFTITTSIFLNFIIYIIAFAIIVFISFKALKSDFLNLSSLNGILIHIVIGLAILYSSNIISAFVTLWVKYLTNDNTITSINQLSLIQQLNSKFAIFSIINIVIFAPIVEEVVFRKGFFSLIKNKWLALIASSLTFGLIHVLGETTLLSFVTNLIIYSISGLALGLVYIRSKKNIWIPIYVHLISNLIATLFILLG